MTQRVNLLPPKSGQQTPQQVVKKLTQAQQRILRAP